MKDSLHRLTSKTSRRFPALVGALLLGLFFAPSLLSADSTNLHESLRKYLALPPIDFEFGFTISTEGFGLMSDRVRDQQDVQAWPKALPRIQNDPEKLLQFGALLEKARKTNDAIEVRERGLEIYEQRLKANSNDVPAQLGFANVLGALKRKSEQKKLLVNELERAPEDWRFYAALAEFHQKEATTAVMYDEEAPRPDPLTKEEVDYLQQPRQTARELWTTAWKHAGDEALAHYQYANFKARERAFPILLAKRQGEPYETNMFFDVFIVPEIMDEYRKSLKGSKDPLAIASVAMFEAFAVAADTKGVRSFAMSALQGIAENLPARSRKVVTDAGDRLETLSRELPDEQASAALEYRAPLQVILLDDVNAAIASGKRAVQLAPAHDSAREMLMGLYGAEKQWTNALSLVEERLERGGSAIWRGYAAKLADQSGHSLEAEQHLRKALSIEPANVFATLALAAFDLRRATNIVGMVKAKMSLHRAHDAFMASEDLAHAQALRTQWFTYLTYAIAYELIEGHLDDASKLVAELLRANPDHETGRKLEKLIKELEATPRSTSE